MDILTNVDQLLYVVIFVTSAYLIMRYYKNYMSESIIGLLCLFFSYFSYSLDCSRNLRLGTIFYDCVLSIPLSVEAILCLLSLVFIIVISFLAYKVTHSHIKNFKLILSVFLITITIWVPLDLISYYDGMERRSTQIMNILEDSTKLILSDNTKDESAKKSALEFLYKNKTSNMSVELYKNENLYLKNNFPLYFYIGNIKYNVKSHSAFFTFDGFSYEFIGKHYRPTVVTGTLRAIFWSALPDFITDGSLMSTNDYIKYNNSQRSINWWILYCSLLGISMISFCYFERVKNEAEELQQSLSEQYKNTGLYQELLFSQLMKELNDIIASKAKSRLQKYMTDIEKGSNKKVYTDAGMDKTISTLDYSLSDRIHTMKNKWNNLVSNDKEAALVKKILQDLNSMKTVFDLTYKNISISEISEIVKASIPEQYTLCESPKFSYSPFESHEYDSFFASINSNRLESIIINLLQNSCSAIERYFYSLPIEKMMQYQGYIKLSTNIEQREGKLYYTITLEDNGGGFPEPEKIYKVPITSSDKSNGERKGAGTLYINTFVRRMNGFIEASNVVLPDNMIGAKTTIYFLLNKEVNNE